MKTHLSKQQLSAYLLQEHTPEVERHLAECSICRAEVSQFREVLSVFRDSVHAWSADQLRTRHRSEAYLPTPARISRPVPGGLLAALAAFILALALWPHATFPWTPATRDTADAELLRRIDRQLAGSVASPMEPLASLVTWENLREPERNGASHWQTPAVTGQHR